MSLRPYLHTVQYYETDSMRIVHHSNYVRWMEEARCDLLEQMDMGYAGIEEAGILIPVLSVSCRYKSMTRFGETVRIFSHLTSYSGVRFALRYEIRDAETGELRCEAESEHCFLGAGGVPVSIRRKFPEWDRKFRENAEEKS